MSERRNDERDERLGGELREELQAILGAETGLSNRFLVLCDWLLDLSTRPFGRIVVGISALMGVWFLL